jgi:hypothetical protein
MSDGDVRPAARAAARAWSAPVKARCSGLCAWLGFGSGAPALPKLSCMRPFERELL